MNILEVRKLSFSYPDEKQKAIENISFNVKKGEVFGIIGPSGCGKSTLMLALSGLIPNSVSGDFLGSVKIKGKETKKLKLEELSQLSQILFQNPDSQLFALNVEDEITFGLENLNKPWKEIENVLNKVLIKTKIENLRKNSIEELSSGQKQKVALAAILSMSPKILLFDEPTANLDQKSIENFANMVEDMRKKHTIIIVEHNIDLVKRVCERVILINNGKILKQGKTRDILRSREYKKIMGSNLSYEETIKRLKRIPYKTNNKILMEIKDLNFSYKKREKVLENLNLQIGKGDFLGILGLNGSGKSTLALNIIGLQRGKGKIIYEGEDITNQDTFNRTKFVGYVFQNPNYQLFEESLEKEIAFGPKNLNLEEIEIKKRVKEALKVTNLFGLKERDPHALSVGQKRRVSIASVLAMYPEVIIVDEPDTGLDFKTACGVMDYIKKLNRRGKTIIIISHNLNLVSKYCNRIVGLKQGKIVSPEEIYKEYLQN